MLAIAAAGCAAPDRGDAATVLAAAVGEWRLVDATVPSGTLAPILAAADVTLVVEADPTGSDGGVLVGGSSGCNRYGTRLTPAARGEVAVGEVAGTLMACVEPDVTALETGYLEGLALVTRVAIDGEALELTGEGVRLRFARTGTAG